MPAPTTEQQKIIEAARTFESGKIQAGAGTGKTTTLRMIAEDQPQRNFLYLAYNKAIQVEASTSFPQNAEARTAHSMAYRAIVKFPKSPLGRKLNGPRVSAKQYAAVLNIRPFTYQHDGETFTVEPWRLAVLVRESLDGKRGFYNSADFKPARRHIPWDIPVSDEQRDRLRDHLLPYVQRAWELVQDPSSELPFVHDTYLKMWSLRKPQLEDYDTILFDEAQDANPCIAFVVEHQDKAQAIMVGDSAQAIYGWRGAVDAMEKFTGWELFLTQSFRFGDAVAEQANRWLKLIDSPMKLKGFDKIQSVVGGFEDTRPNAILCRTNAGVIESAMEAQQAGQQVAIAGGTSEIEAFVKGANNLMQGIPTYHPELAMFKSWSDVQEAVKNGEAADIGMMVRLVDNYGTHAILEVCRNSTTLKPQEIQQWVSQPGHVMVSTAHKAKGLEWDRVRIHHDFKAPKADEETGRRKVNVAEAMLIYVAVTRAKQHLDNAALSWLDELESEINAQMDKGEES